MFATLCGTDKESSHHDLMFRRLFEIAIKDGFEAPDTLLRIERNQIPLDGWSLEQRGPSNGQADFYLSVTAPRLVNISPVPIKINVTGPLFAVNVMDSFFIVSRADRRDVSEFRDTTDVENAFANFLKEISKPV